MAIATKIANSPVPMAPSDLRLINGHRGRHRVTQQGVAAIVLAAPEPLYVSFIIATVFFRRTECVDLKNA